MLLTGNEELLGKDSEQDHLSDSEDDDAKDEKEKAASSVETTDSPVRKNGITTQRPVNVESQDDTISDINYKDNPICDNFNNDEKEVQDSLTDLNFEQCDFVPVIDANFESDLPDVKVSVASCPPILVPILEGQVLHTPVNSDDKRRFSSNFQVSFVWNYL